ncbi:DUF4097 family beta strand repeat-containing protein [Isoptericola jiangsuensis]|uniref:DUF4097 family beta strand repeat-containing protein n=1 Tax=Isoptericola jiangsuensis TaxID=548579 RepID=UPI003AAFC3AC
MPTFAVDHPVHLQVDVPFANLHVVASERDDVVVTAVPSDPGRSGSVRAAEEIRVDRDGDTVTISYPGSWKQWVLPFAAGTADISVELPAGSELRGKTGSLYAEGALGVVEMSLAAGDARVDDAARLVLKVAAGSVTVGRTSGSAQISASAGSVRLDHVSGDSSVKAANGTVSVGTVTGSLTVRGSNGDISVSRSLGTVTARSAHASIRVDRLEAGTADLTTSFGTIDVGVPEGTAAYLDLSCEHGTVRNQLTPTEGPVADESTAELRAGTGYGDVVVRRPLA